MSLLRKCLVTLLDATRKAVVPQQQARSLHHLSIHNISDKELDDKFERFFNRCDIDGWDIRQGMNDLCALDLVPEPRIIIAALYACRRVNDYSLAVRFIETVKSKCGPNVGTIYPYVIQEIAPVLCELGVDTPEALGYHKPELWLENVYHMQ